MYNEIRYDVANPVATITLNRPAAMNAWTPTMDGEVRDAVSRANDDTNVVGIIVTGEGRAFCAGADMNHLDNISSGAVQSGAAPSDSTQSDATPSTDDWRNPVGEFGGRFPYLLATDKPIIAAVNGAVAGMAYPFALCCDIRVTTPDAVFVTSFAQRGLIAEWGLSWLLPRLVGPANALDLLFSSRKVKGEEAKELGLANYCVPAEELLPFCENYIKQLAQTCSPTSLKIMKAQVYQQLHQGLGDAEREAQKLMAESFKRGDFKEGVRSFMEKRSPEFPRVGN